MKTTKRQIIRGGSLVDAPGYYRISWTHEGDDERSWDVVRKPDGTYWKVAGIDFSVCGPPVSISLGNQIVDAKALKLCEENYKQIRDTEGATIGVSGLRKVPGTDPQQYELRFYGRHIGTAEYFQTAKGTRMQIRAILEDGGQTRGQIEYYFART